MGSYPHRQNASQNDVLGNPTSQTPQANYGAKIQSEITSNYLREYMLLKPQERYQFLETISLRNSQSLLEFLINLKTTCSSNFYDGMFGLIHELIVNSKVDLQIKTRLFVQSLLFYKNEIILIDQELLKNAMILLAQRPNSEQTLGLANYIFINEIEAFATLQEELVLLDRKNIGIIPLMGCTFTSFKIDPQVIRLLPNTLQCLNKPFIQILKQDHGLRLIRDIPINVVGDFLQISALSQAQSCTDLVKLISHISDIFVKKWDYLYQSDFSLLIAQFSVELKERNLRWISKLQEILEVIDQVTFIQLEKGISNRPDVVFHLINGNTNSLKAILKNPKIVEDLSGQQFFKMIGQLKKINKQNKDVFQYCCELQENQLIKSESLGMLEGLLGFSFYHFKNFALTILCMMLSLINFITLVQVMGKLYYAQLLPFYQQMIIRKHYYNWENDYLVLRDEKRFSDVIIKSGLNINYNQFEDKLGVYYMTQKHFDSLTQDDYFLRQLESSIVILDEYDWLFFDGQPAYMFETINHLKRASKLIGLTGSILTQKEQTCLDSSFGVQEVNFPTLNSLKADKKTHHQDLLFNQQQSEFCKYLYELSMKQTLVTPLIIVASTSYVMIEHYFKKLKELQFFSMKGIKGSKADAYLEEKFNIQNTNKRYGVFLLSEIQGRGTDFHSSREIEDNGGIYLIVADIFSKKSTQQIVGRVGRLENKGQ
ncbi:Protein translocase subunit SecA [Oxytricha trifallax]|uniref:Protein translocase subunit SecA n=1 Tax=Oxytricha trifallax TaxID=1172189 RepID=A0A073IAV6_9SPIT|nr:Protein translocase subunit SecA [Oxytricha trifallax]